MQLIHVLIIDDDKKYCERLARTFAAVGRSMDYDVKLADYQNLTDGIAELSKNSKYKAVILDGKCRIDADGKEDFGFLPLALNKLWELNRQTGRHYMPFAVCTAYYDKYDSHKLLVEEQKGRMFDKSIQEEEMMKWLLEEIKKAPETKLEIEFPDIFDIFTKGYLNNTARRDLVSILKNIDDEARIGTTLAALRVFQENIYNTLEASGKVNLNGCNSFGSINKRLSGDIRPPQYQPTQTLYQTVTIDCLANAIYKIGSSYGNHVPVRPTVTVKYWEEPSIYAVKSLVYALLEQLLWFKSLMQQP